MICPTTLEKPKFEGSIVPIWGSESRTPMVSSRSSGEAPHVSSRPGRLQSVRIMTRPQRPCSVPLVGVNTKHVVLQPFPGLGSGSASLLSASQADSHNSPSGPVILTSHPPSSHPRQSFLSDLRARCSAPCGLGASCRTLTGRYLRRGDHEPISESVKLRSEQRLHNLCSPCDSFSSFP